MTTSFFKVLFDFYLETSQALYKIMRDAFAVMHGTKTGLKSLRKELDLQRAIYGHSIQKLSYTAEMFIKRRSAFVLVNSDGNAVDMAHGHHLLSWSTV